MSAAMDMYLSTGDSLSIQDMLDIDIKSEIDILVGGHNDLSDFNFSDLPPLELDDASNVRWFSGHSNSSFNFDEDGSTMVNPNTVMPLGSTITLAQSIRSPSPTIKESHLRFSPATVKAGGLKSDTAHVKRDLLSKLSEVGVRETSVKVMPKILPKQQVISTKHSVQKNVKSNTTLLSFKNAVQQQLMSPISVAQINNLNTVRTVHTTHNRKQMLNNRVCHEDERAFPKPAYSYSCLIAMALKNSRTGSLPVSEIYNFMCRHFPYFKTAPNGWKNSVRHNLSLNKCFEKIEKPAINGAQRKGCLWAMNPAKITKMDDEVQKWSRKDPTAIRKAMVKPEHLEMLERGELKFTYEDADNFGDSCGSAESEEGSDTEPEAEIENTLNGESHFFGITTIKAETEDDYDVDVTDTMYDDMDIEDDQEEILRVEMALAQKELLEYERSVNNKKRRIYLLQE